MIASPVLETRNLNVSFGGIRAVTGVSISVARGELAGLIGPNGAGKTTFIDSVSGFLPYSTTGEVLLDGKALRRLAPHRRVHHGLCRTWQSLELFNDISIEDNLKISSGKLTFLGSITDFWKPRTTGVEIEAIMERLGIAHIAKRLPRDLSQGEKKLVTVARALASDAKLILLDEPAAGLDSREAEWLGNILRTIVMDGTAILLVDHDTRLILSTCDQVHVLQFGKLIASGTPTQIRSNERVTETYLGSGHDV